MSGTFLAQLTAFYTSWSNPVCLFVCVYVCLYVNQDGTNHRCKKV